MDNSVEGAVVFRNSLTASFVPAFFLCAPAFAQEESPPPIGSEEQIGFEEFLARFTWLEDGTGKLGSRAEIDIPSGHRFLTGDQVGPLLEAMGNLSDHDELGLIGVEDLEWFVVFLFDDIGYVEDDEKDELDPEALASTISRNLERSNEIRRERGMEEMRFDGWALEPRYNEETNQLEWASRIASDSGVSVNYNTRVLGRKGVMRTILVASPDGLEEILPDYRRLMEGFRFVDGQRYAQYVPGDKIAEYGLMALIAGGAGAVAAKTGLLTGIILFFKKGAKFILVGLVALGAGIKRFFFRSRTPSV
jgi:uncharacterized membrane-anchored protein